jgi:uncharacterized membrane protein YtjA (UPF0391 family)
LRPGRGIFFLEIDYECEGVKGEIHMLRWSAIFLVIALVAALFGFGGSAGAAADIVKFLFFLFIGIVVILFLLGMFLGGEL